MAKNKGASPTQLTLKELRKRGHSHQIVEYWNSFAHKRVDLWGFGDILVMDDQTGSLLIQTTTSGSLSPQKKKILESPFMPEWMERGNRISIWAWRKIWMKNRLGREQRMWGLREIDLLWNIDHFVWFEVSPPATQEEGALV